MTENRSFAAVVLAAGFGTRMNSDLPKVLHCLGDMSLAERVVRKVSALSPDRIIVVTGYKADLVEEELKSRLSDFPTDISFFRQTLLKGSGRAVQEAVGEICKSDEVLILCGDAPLFRPRTIAGMYKFFREGNCDCAVMTAELEDPASYGRIIRDEKAGISAIVEADGAGEEVLAVREVNSGTYFFRTAALKEAVSGLKPKGSKGEFYLTDAVENIIAAGGRAEAYKIEDSSEITGINSRADLAAAYKTLCLRKAAELMKEGVTITDPSNTYIEESVSIGKDTVVFPEVFIKGNTVIGKNCKIGPAGVIDSCIIDDNASVKYSCVLEKSHVRSGAAVGPMARLRPMSDIGEGAEVGNFAEIKKSVIGKGSKIHHHSYIGDTVMGEKVNIGAGTITCNYDGKKKNGTVIGDGAFIGSNSNLVAPVSIGKAAYTAAGSTITSPVYDGELGIGRARQINKVFKRKN